MLEALWAGDPFAPCHQVRRVVPFHGALFLVVAAGYACGRSLMEFSRERETDAPGFTWDHGISLITLLASVSLLLFSGASKCSGGPWHSDDPTGRLYPSRRVEFFIGETFDGEPIDRRF